MTLVQEYLDLTKQYISKYGEKTLLLMQVGAFFEVYALRNKLGKISGSQMEDFSRVCDLTMTDKQICVGKDNVMMSGFRDYVLDKYLEKLQTAEYTVVVYVQDEATSGTTRSLSAIYSPGTYFSQSSETITNNIMCIWIHKIRGRIIFGLSNIDIYTGRSTVFEYDTEYSHYSISCDELERFVHIYQPKEVIIIYNVDTGVLKTIIQHANFSTRCIHLLNSGENLPRIKHCEKQVYQVEIYNKYFGQVMPEEYKTWTIAMQSYCYLLEFIYEHNPHLVSKISEPVFENSLNRMILGNHSLRQLNILSDNKKRNTSVANFLNRCVTVMGQRRLFNVIVSPRLDIEYLNQEYELCDYLLNHYDMVEIVREKLKGLKDYEKLTRKLVLKRITPRDLAELYESLSATKELWGILSNDVYLKQYLDYREVHELFPDGDVVLDKLKEVLDFDKCREMPCNGIDYSVNFMNSGVDIEYDALVDKYHGSLRALEVIRSELNSKVQQIESSKKTNQFVKIHKTDKMGYSVVATKRRVELLKSMIQSGETIIVDGETNITIQLRELQYHKSTGSNYVISHDKINQLCKSILVLKDNLEQHLCSLYGEFLSQLLDYIEYLERFVEFISLTDVIYCKAFIAKEFRYCRPEIVAKEDDTVGQSYVNVEGLRHILIERLLTDELYVTNDVDLDSSQQGILLYGTNAVGKSSFIKSLGIAVIMAQAGFYVPCSTMTYYPFDYIFTRILGNDDLFRGLSTFAVEMLEFKAILKYADKKTLVLGDELCSGTETTSAISIFLAGINSLYTSRSKFIFATHFHEIVEFDEIMTKERLSLKHMTVQYNPEEDKLVYERKLMPGPGTNMYGLEVCKALHLPEDFLKEAHQLRNKYYTKDLVLDYQSSHFNAKKLMGLCERCKKKKSTEVHHLQHQKDADEEGFIGKFHKNHMGNLIALCHECHEQLHKDTSKGHVRQKTGLHSTGILREV